jgi:hypothetical protein
MRSYSVYGIRNQVETFVTTVYNAAEGKIAHQLMKEQGFYDVIKVRDALGGICFVYNLRTGEKIA